MMAEAEMGYGYEAEEITFEDLDLADLSEEEFEDLKESLLELASQNPNDCPQQEIIQEEELEDFLNDGYRFVAHTNGGKVIVER